MLQALINTLLQELPRYAEEEGDYFSVPRGALIDTIVHCHAVEPSVAENTVTLCERLLETLSVLNAEYLSRGEWCFVSFPAQLLATSVLTALGDRDSRFFAANFWNTQGISSHKKDQQREVLSRLENARNDHHARRQASPIRYCYVAWSIIKLDGRILFYQREDTRKRFDKSAGDYGLIGGRANQSDVSMTDKAALLKALQSPDSEPVKQALPQTLKRELREEAGLLFETHYTFKSWRCLKPYRQVQGAAPNHALTEYYLEIFRIDLTLEGHLFLQQKIKNDERLVWFSIEEMAQGETGDGKIAYIRALYEDFAGDRTALAQELIAVPESFTSEYKFQPTKYGLTLPIHHNGPLLAGILGKEKPLDLPLTERQHAILLGLAAHLRGFEFLSVEEDIILHPLGWIQVADQSSIQHELIKLADFLKNSDLVTENYRNILFRLSIIPAVVFFDESLFSFAVKRTDMDTMEVDKIPVSLHRNSFDTAIGKIAAKTEIFKLTLDYAHKLNKLFDNPRNIETDVAIQIEDNYKKGLHKDPGFLAFGLRNLIRRESGVVKFVLRFLIT